MGLGAEVTAMVCEAAMDHLKAPPSRVTMPDVAGIPLTAFVFVFYVPLGYYTDQLVYRRRQKLEAKKAT